MKKLILLISLILTLAACQPQVGSVCKVVKIQLINNPNYKYKVEIYHDDIGIGKSYLYTNTQYYVGQTIELK